MLNQNSILSSNTSGSGSADGDVIGPASSTDNAVVRYNGTTGKLVQNSAVTIDDSGKVSVGTNAAYGATLGQFNGANAVIANTAGQFSIGTTDTAAADVGGSLGFTANTTTLAGYPMGSISARLVAAGAGAYESYMAFATTGAGGTVAERMRITDTGSVGIGTASPAKSLTISSNANAQSTATIPGIRIENTDTTAVSTNVTGEIEFFSKDASEVDKISGFIKNVAEDAGTKYALTFGAKAAGANAAEAMRIDSSGNVGIGTAAPSDLLELFSAADTTLKLTNTNTSVGNAEITNSIIFQTNDASTGGTGETGYIKQVSEVSTGNQFGLAFGASNNPGPANEKMRITGQGNVGIGTASPDAVLNLDHPTDTRLLFNGGSTGASYGIDWGFTSSVNKYASVNFDYDDRSSKGLQLNSGYTITFNDIGTDGAIDAEWMRITSAGDVIIGDTAVPSGTTNAIAVADATYKYLKCSKDSTATRTQIQFLNPNGLIGSVTTTGSATAYNTSSDYRLKENVVPMQDALQRITQLKPSRFNFIADDSVVVDGFLAHEVQEHVPEAISGKKDAIKDEEYEVTPAVLDDDGNEITPAVMDTRSVPDYQGIDQSKLVPLLVGAIQELTARIAALENN
jgi:hypothetical protein